MNPQDTVNAEILEGLSGAERESFKAGLKALNMNPNPDTRQALRESFRRMCPEWTEAQLTIAVDGDVKPAPLWPLQEALADQDRANFIGQIAAAYRELNPGTSEDDVAQWAADNIKKVEAKPKEPEMATATVAHCVADVLRDEQDTLKAQEIPDALAARHPEWSAQKRARWLSDHEGLLQAYRGLHEEWSGSQLVTAVDDSEDTGATY